MIPVLIAGAGPTGLALALWLARRGVRVRIVDKAADAGTTSRALAVQVRTIEFYRQLGLATALVEDGVKIAGLNFWAGGRRAARVDVRGIGDGLTPFPFILVHPQDRHEQLLIGALADAGVHVERNVELVALQQSSSSVRATLKHASGALEPCDAEWVAGCDGASSAVRHQLGIGFPGGTYEGRFYVADVEATGAAVDDELHVDLEASDFALVFPMKGKGRIRLVGIVRDVDEDGQLTFEDVRGRALDHLGLDVTAVNWFSTYNVHHRVANQFRNGRVFLLGDAAHIHSPVGGQGMNTGIGDAVNLGWKLAAVIRGESPVSLLDSYEPERIGFARELVETTDRVFTFVTRQGRLARFVRTRVAPVVIPRVLRRPAALRFLFRRVSQTGIRYRSGPLSTGRAGAVHGGDRLPWVALGNGRDNFEPLSSLAWQAHVYGEPRGDLRTACEAAQLPLHVFAWQPRMRAAGLAENALYVIRPDGYVALAAREARAANLDTYLSSISR